MNNPVETLRKLADKLSIDEISNVVLDDERFPLWSGSSRPNQHHYGKGGLAQHTLEVVEIALKINEYFREFHDNKSIHESTIFLAALFHDSGKMWDYIPVDSSYQNWNSSKHKRDIHHISKSVILWNSVAENYYEETFCDEITHAILAHHQSREWGSPVYPNSRLAWLLVSADIASARMDDVDKWDRIKK